MRLDSAAMVIEIEDLRALLRDDDEVAFSDEALSVAIVNAGDNLYRAAGMAVQSLAIEYAAAGRSIKTDDLMLDTRGRGKDLLEVAESFFAQARTEDAAGGDEFFAVVPNRGCGYSCARPEGTPRPLACCGRC